MRMIETSSNVTDVGSDRVTVYRVESALRDGSKYYRILEPFTWGWIGATLAEGVIAGVAGKVATDVVFGGDSLGDSLKEVTKAFAAQVRAILEQQRVSRLEAQSMSLQRLWKEHQNSPDHTQLMLILNVSSDLVAEAFALGLAGVPAYTICCGIRLAALQVRHHSSQFSTGDAKNLQQAGVDYAKDAHVNASRLKFWNESRFGPVYAVRESYPGSTRRPPGDGPSDRPPHTLQRVIEWRCDLDGSPIHVCDGNNTGETAESARGAIIERERARMDAELLGSLWVVASKWHEIGNGNFPKDAGSIKG